MRDWEQGWRRTSEERRGEAKRLTESSWASQRRTPVCAEHGLGWCVAQPGGLWRKPSPGLAQLPRPQFHPTRGHLAQSGMQGAWTHAGLVVIGDTTHQTPTSLLWQRNPVKRHSSHEVDTDQAKREIHFNWKKMKGQLRHMIDAQVRLSVKTNVFYMLQVNE